MHSPGYVIEFNFEVYDHLCRIWTSDSWDIQSCQVAPDTSEKLVHCQCKHLSLFGASVLVPPNKIHPLQDIPLFLTIRSNPYVFTFVILLLSIYFALFIWAWRMDKKDRNQREVYLLIDNYPGDTYGYLLAIFTGEKPMSGTTGKVGVRIYGANGAKSHAHILNHDNNTLQIAQDNWFLIFSPTDLGQIQYLHVWHDNSGSSPDWNCNKIIIYDISTNEKSTFVVGKWLSVRSARKNDWKLEWKLKPTSMKEGEWQNLAKENFFIGLREKHLWISIFVRHPRTPYTRLQRLTVAMCIVMVSMLCAIMFYGAAEKMTADDPTYSLKMREFIVSLEVALITMPVSIFVATLFKKSWRVPKKKEIGKRRRTKREIFSDLIKNFLTLDPLMPVELGEEEAPAEHKDSRKRKIMLIAAWTVSFIIIFGCSFFLMLYGLRLGPKNSMSWISVILIKMLYAILITQPIKIIVCAFFFAFVFKESRRDQMSFSIEYKGVDQKLKEDALYMSKLMELRSKPMYNPLSELDVVLLSRKRKRFDRQKWNIINFLFTSVMYISLSVLIAGSDTTTSHYHTTHLLDVLKTPVTASDYYIHQVYNKSRFFDYLLRTLLPSIHTTTWYNGEKLPIEIEEKGFPNDKLRGWTSDYSSKLLGVPRIRQLRIIQDSCTVPEVFKSHFNKCNGSFSMLIQDKTSYARGWSTFKGISEIWKYSSYSETQTTLMHGALGYLYPGGGYVKNLTTTYKNSAKEITRLKLENWFDELTRVIFVEFNLYNVFSNLFSQVTIIFENLACGVIGSRVYIDTSYQHMSLKNIGGAYVVALIFYIVVLILSMVKFVIQVSVQGIGPFLDYYENIIDILVIFFGVAGVIAYLVRAGFFKVYSDAFEQTDNETYISFSYPFFQTDLTALIFCITVFLITIRIIQLARYGKYFYIIKKALKESRPYVISILILVLFFTTLLSFVAFLTGTQKDHIWNIFLVPRIKFSDYLESYKFDSYEIFFRIALNLIYLIGGILMSAVFIFFYAKSKFYLISIGKVEGYTNQFSYMYNRFQQNWRTLIQDNDELHIQEGNATRREKMNYRRKLFAEAKEKVTYDYKLKKWEAEDIMKDFVNASKRHKKMCEQLDQILELIE